MKRSPEDEFYFSLVKAILLFMAIIIAIILGNKADNYLTEKGYMEWVK